MEDTTARMMQMVDERNEELDQSLNKEELEKKINFEEAQVSANEKHTTATESEDDLEKEEVLYKPEGIDPKRVSSQIDEASKNASAISDEVERKFIELGSK